MKKWNGLIASILILSLAAVTLHAVQAKDEPAGTKIEAPNETIKIGDILKNGSAFQNRWVTLNGTIITECKLGYKFKLDDGSGNISVDLKMRNPNGFVIPQKKGSIAKAYGKVSSASNTTYILGQNVEIDGKTFRAQEPEELEDAAIKIGDIIKNESLYLRKAVVVEGKITTERGLGDWFNLDDSTGNVSVDTASHNFTIPQRKGFEAKVYGRLYNKDNITYISGKIVKIDEDIFRGT